MPTWYQRSREGLRRALWLSGGQPLRGMPTVVQDLGGGSIGWFPCSAVLVIALAALALLYGGREARSRGKGLPVTLRGLRPSSPQQTPGTEPMLSTRSLPISR